jgi:hypothetical protein
MRSPDRISKPFEGQLDFGHEQDKRHKAIAVARASGNAYGEGTVVGITIHYDRETFASAPDNFIGTRMWMEGAEAFNTNISFDIEQSVPIRDWPPAGNNG